jgi:hypothetical protein
MCFVWISEQTAIISLYNINWLVSTHVRKIAIHDYQFTHVHVSVRPSESNSDPNGRIFMKFDIWVFFQNCPENSSSNKISQEQPVPYTKTYGHLWYLGELFLEW